MSKASKWASPASAGGLDAKAGNARDGGVRRRVHVGGHRRRLTGDDIAPWNAPVILGVRAVAWALALALGSTVVFKGSEQSPRVHAAIVRALADAEVPPGVINFLTNDPGQAPRSSVRSWSIPRPRTSTSPGPHAWDGSSPGSRHRA